MLKFGSLRPVKHLSLLQGQAQTWLWGGIMALIIFGCYLGPVVFSLPGPNTTDFSHTLAPLFRPGHLLGTDALGRDMLSRCLYGGRISLEVGILSVALGLIVGSALGIMAGYKGGILDAVIMRALDVLLAFPGLILALTIATYLGANQRNVTLAIAFFTVPAYARVARASTLRVKEFDYVSAARMWGATDWYIGSRHVFPNILLPLLTYAFVLIGIAMIIEAGLSFLGLGVQPPQASWGSIIAAGKADLSNAPHVALVPGVFLLVTVVALNRLGDLIQARISGGDYNA